MKWRKSGSQHVAQGRVDEYAIEPDAVRQSGWAVLINGFRFEHAETKAEARAVCEAHNSRQATSDVPTSVHA